MDIPNIMPNNIQNATCMHRDMPIKRREDLRNTLPEYMTKPDCRRWLLHNNKVPYYSNGKKRGKTDTQEDLAQLVSFDETYDVYAKGAYTGLGFALGADGKGGYWQGIDLDDVWSNHELYILKPPGYVELSPSGKGWHALGYGRDFITLASNGTSIESYSHGRYFTITGNAINGWLGLDAPTQPICLANYVEQVLCPMHGTSIDTQKKNIPKISNASKTLTKLSSEQMQDLRSALFSMPADERGLWIAIGHALRWVEGGYELWAEWSATSDKYMGDSDLALWGGFSGDNTGYQAVFAYAQKKGWINPRTGPDPKEIFKRLPDNQVQLIPPLLLGWSEIIVSDVFTNPPKPPQFLIAELLPAGELTLLSAHGGTGKSMLALQAAVCLATGYSFMGKDVEKCRVLFYSGEDKNEIIRHRFQKICRQMQLDPKEVAKNIQLIDATESPYIYQETKATNAYFSLLACTQAFVTDVIIIDNASDTFDGNENSRSQVQGFLCALKRLGTVLLLSHIDKNKAKGDYNSEGYSGSTAWNNSARSRLYLTKDDKGGLKLEHQKSNHGQLSKPISMTFSADYVLVLNNESNNDLFETNLKIVLKLIDRYYKQDDFISPANNARPNTFKALKDHPEFPKSICDNKQMKSILLHAENTGLLRREEYKNLDSKNRKRYKLTDKAQNLISSLYPPSTNKEQIT
ncbi:AAA family ATPase [Legionella sp. 227]|uniref:AAA family ATPase n=1 Tax=Legionella sp. 227 TaxID=3367288 RepID=UPI00370D3BB4